MKVSKIYKKVATVGVLLSGVCLGVINAEGGDNAVAQALKAVGLEASGFVSTSYVESNRNSNASSFSMEQAELDLKAKSGDASLTLDLDFHDGSSKSQNYSFSGGEGGEVEQAYIGYENVGGLEGLNAQFGKWNAPIGLEGYDAPDRSQWSLSYTFFNAIPANMTGLKFEYGPDSLAGLSFEAFIANGWDSNADTNSGKTFGFGAGYSNDDLGITWAADYFTGSETNRGVTTISEAHRHRRNVFDTFIQYSIPGLDGAWVAYEYLEADDDAASTQRPSDSSSSWSGRIYKAHMPLVNDGDTETLGLTVRYETFQDRGNATTPALTTGRTPLNMQLSSGNEKVAATTVALNFVVPETEGAVTGHLEYRHDKTKHNAFNSTRNGATNDSSHNNTVALNLIYSF